MCIRDSLEALLNCEEEKVGFLLEDVHDGMQEFKEYNNEHTLKCVIHLAFYAAADDYVLKFEQTAGKGYADCIMIPKKPDRPGIVLELKYNSSAEKAITQIKERNYIRVFDKGIHEVYLVGINYDKNAKHHQCIIETVKKN